MVSVCIFLSPQVASLCRFLNVSELRRHTSYCTGSIESTPSNSLSLQDLGKKRHFDWTIISYAKLNTQVESRSVVVTFEGGMASLMENEPGS